MKRIFIKILLFVISFSGISQNPILYRKIGFTRQTTITPVNNFIQAIGGTVTRIGDSLIHEFSTLDSNIYFINTSSLTARYFIISGGAGGGGGKGNGASSGGGGAGMVRTGTFSPITMPYTVFSGTGGIGGTGSAIIPTKGENGGENYFNGLTLLGGGYGASTTDGGNGGNGGGAGSPASNFSGGIGIDFNGGDNISNNEPYNGGGGGSSLQNGFNGSVSGNGGVGYTTTITGTLTVFAGGGGGGCYETRQFGLGGSNVGGNGNDVGNGHNGSTYGSGGGGGGSPFAGVGGNGGEGKEGRVFIKYYSPTTPTVSGYKYAVTQLTNTTAYTATDSHRVVLFNDTLYKFLGWDGITNLVEVWKSKDGVSWIRSVDFPGGGRDWSGVNVVGSFIYLYGGSGAVDLWKFDGFTWTQITSDCGIPVVYFPNTATDGTYLYYIGGQSSVSTSTLYFDVYKISVSGTSTLIGALPTTTDGISAGILLFKENVFYLYGGGYFSAIGVTNNKVYNSLDFGVTWNVVSTITNTLLLATTPTGFLWDSKLWWIPTNEIGLYYSGDNGLNFIKAPMYTLGTHAATGCENSDGDLIIQRGYDANGIGPVNDVFKLFKIGL